jgi:hypothetical protein
MIYRIFDDLRQAGKRKDSGWQGQDDRETSARSAHGLFLSAWSRKAL